jgi:hypothetical protein
MKDRSIVHTIKEGRITGFVTSGVGTAFKNTLLKGRWRQKGRGNEEEEVA